LAEKVLTYDSTFASPQGRSALLNATLIALENM
jgi:hypothetical protein